MASVHFSDRGEYIVATRDEVLDAWLAQGYESLHGDAAERVIERLLLNSDPRAGKRLWELAEGDEPPRIDAHDRRERLRRVVAGPRAPLRVLQRRQERSYGVPEAIELPAKPKTLAEQMQSITLLLVEDFGNPAAAKLSYELDLDEDGPRPGTFGADGGAREDGLRPGSGSVKLPGVHPGAWQERTEPPHGWPRERLSVTLLDAQGVPMGAHPLKAIYDNGATLSAKLDESGYARLEGTPSYPLRVEFPDFDPEKWK